MNPILILDNEEQRNDALKRAAVVDLQKVPGIGCVELYLISG